MTFKKKFCTPKVSLKSKSWKKRPINFNTLNTDADFSIIHNSLTHVSSPCSIKKNYFFVHEFIARK